MSNPEIIAIPQRCGTCEHTHQGLVPAGADLPACDTCGCAAFVLHDDELAAAQAAEDADAADFPHGRLIDGDMVRGLHGVVRALEAQFGDEIGWDIPPLLGVFFAGSIGPGPAGAQMMGVSVAPLNLEYSGLLHAANGDVEMAATLLAEMAEDQPSLFDKWREGAGNLDPRQPVVAWWAAYEAYVRPDGGPRADEVREVICIDADERVHEVVRLRSTGEVRAAVDSLARYTAQVTGGDDTGRPTVRMRRLDGGGIPPLPHALLRLMRVSRTEAALRAAGHEIRKNT